MVLLDVHVCPKSPVTSLVSLACRPVICKGWEIGGVWDVGCGAPTLGLVESVL